MDFEAEHPRNKDGTFALKDSGGSTKSSKEGLTSGGGSGKIVSIENVTGETATINERKFTEYALNPIKQPDKARAFKEALGYDLSNYQLLEKQLMKNFDKTSLKFKGSDEYGKKYELLYVLTGENGKTAKVMTGWIDDSNDFRLVTLYVDK